MGRIGGDHGGDGTAREMVAEGAGIEGTVGDHDLGEQAFDQGSASVISCLWPGVRRTRNGLPSASTEMWSLVLKPPREHPIA